MTDFGQDLYDRTVIGQDGEKLGTVSEVYVDEDTGRPEWAELKTGFFGHKTALVPLAAASSAGRELRVPFDKKRVQGAPHHEPGETLSTTEEEELFAYFGIPYGGETVTASGDSGVGQVPFAGSEGRDLSGPTTDDAMTRSEEELRVGTARREAGRARLRKYVVTEHVQTTVPVRHEEVRIEREPITEANVASAMDGPDISEEEHEVLLYEEQPVVATEVVPKERVRLTTETVEDEATVSAELRKERIESEGTERAV